MIDTLQIPDTAFVCIVRICLQSVCDIHIWSGFAHRHHLYDTLACRVGKVVPTDEGITLGYQGHVAPLHGSREVLERHPIQPVFTQGHITDTHSGNDQFVLLRYVVVIFFARHPIVLLYHDAVIHTKRIVQLAVLRVEPHTPGCRVVVVHLQHGRKYTVVILAEHLRYHEFEDTECTAYNQIIKFTHGLGFFHSSRIDVLLQLHRPALAGHKTRYEILGRKVSPELGITIHLQPAQFGQAIGVQLAAILAASGI